MPDLKAHLLRCKRMHEAHVEPGIEFPFEAVIGCEGLGLQRSKMLKGPSGGSLSASNCTEGMNAISEFKNKHRCQRSGQQQLLMK